MTDYEFTCPDCREEILVDDEIRDALIAQGCVVCNGQVPPSAFEELPSGTGTGP